MNAFIDYSMDYVVSLDNLITGEKEGRILARYTKSGTCYAMVQLYERNSYNGKFTCGEGKASGYGYDKLSAAIVDACKKAKSSQYDEKTKEYKEVKNPLLTGTHDEISGFVFVNGNYERKEKNLAEILEKRIIPVYSGTDNQSEAFGLYFRYNQVF